MVYIKYSCFAFVALLFFSCSTRQRMVNYDVSYVYHPDKPVIRKKILNTADSLKILLSYNHPIDFNKLSEEDFISNNKFIYKITFDHSSADVIVSDSIQLSTDQVKKNDKTFYCSFQIPKPATTPALLIIYKKDIKRNRVEVIDIPLESSPSAISNDYLLLHTNNNIPVLNNYFSIQDTLKIISNVRPEDSLYVFHYNHTFSPAPPPMGYINTIDSKTLNIDTSFRVYVNQPLFFDKPGLYFIQKDTNSNYGFSYLAKDYKYPFITKAEEMIDPLIYLTSREEYERLKNTINPKAAVDSFWLKIGGSKDYSRELIKSYYQRVEYSNKAFTSYKEGWKTDRGIIYIIFGKPDQVYMWGDKEEWVYENILTHIVTFSFIKKSNIFSDEHYELIRNPGYESYWDLTIDKWRSGIITK